MDEEYVAKLLESEFLCPRCGQGLTPVGSTSLICACEEGNYEIVDGVAILVPPGLSRGTVETIETFAYKWAYDTEAMREERTRIANQWFLDRFGFADEDALRLFLKDKERILDAGCGIGNLTALIARLAPHAEVWGVDLSTSVHAVPRAANIRLVQGDITHLPIKGVFDLIVSDGVLHHTPDTRDAMEQVAKHLAPDGDFLFYVYKVKAPVREFTDDFLRERISAMPPEEAMTACEAIADIGRQLREAKVTLNVTKPLPLLGIPAGEIDLQRFVYWYFFKCFHDDGGNRAASVLENFDWYHPKFAWRQTWEAVSRWIEEAGLECTYCDASMSGFAVRARWRRRREGER
jgi:SAM-dependent methyltransferase